MGEKYKLVILSRSFAKASSEPIDLLDEQKDIEYRIISNSRPEDLEYIVSQVKDADALIVGSDILNRTVLEQCRNLKVISKHGVGLDNIDIDYAEKRGIRVLKAEGTNSESVADMTIMLMLMVLRNAKENTIQTNCPDWSTKKLTNDLFGKTVGIVGFGEIGKAVSRRLQGFNCEILIYDPVISTIDDGYAKLRRVDFDVLLTNSDIISLHAPLSTHTYHLINKTALEKMKRTAVIINTARGSLVDETALYEKLSTGNLLGAGLDVFSTEPPIGEPLLSLKNVVATGHIATHTEESNCRMGVKAVQNVIDALLTIKTDKINEIKR